MAKNVSFLVCTYNAPVHIKKCLDSIIRQKYSGKKEIIIMDGGSEGKTIVLLKRYMEKHKFIKLFHNKKKLPEGYGKGKWAGWKKCTGEFVFIVDQDNELHGENCLNEMLKPFKNEEIFGSLCRLAVDCRDSITNQYISLVGTDPFMAYKSVDGMINIKKLGEDSGDYSILKIKKDCLLITGGNCFVYRKKYLDKVGGYVQDTENIARLVEIGKNKVAIPKDAFTHHKATTGFIDFIMKKKKWAKAYAPAEEKYSYLPSSKEDRRKFLINLFFIFTILPNIYIAFRQIVKSREKAWIMHPILSFITGVIYFIYAFLRIKLFTIN